MGKKIKETEEQLNIINSEADVKRIIACAGSGKTRVITGNIIKILNEGICSPDNILVLTFTRNAAENMRLRVRKNIKKDIDSENINIFTFNSFGNEIISENSFELGLGKDFKIINSSQSWQILYEIFDESSLKYIKTKKKVGEFLQNLLNYIEDLKNNLVSVEQFREYLNNYREITASYKSRALRKREEELINIHRELSGIYQEYEKRKIGTNCIDYPDQVFLPYFLFCKRKTIRDRYCQRFRYIFVDEFQDTNVAQAYLLSLLYKPGYNRLAVVGDDDQGIYSFRGACVENILDFHKFDKFKNRHVYDFYLTTNFRSGDSIIETVSSIISANKKRFNKELKSESKKKDSAVVFYSKKTHEEEAAEIAEIIKYLASGGIKLKEIAILARRKRFGGIIKELEAKGIKFELIGGKNFFFEPEILFIISWLKAAEDINDEISITYLLKSDKYKICDRDMYFIKRKPGGSGEKVDLIDGVINSGSNPYLSGETKKRLKDFIESLRLYISRSGELELKELISLITEDSGIMNELKSEFGPVAKRKIKNIESLIRVSSDFQKSNLQSNLSGFITYLRDVAKTDYDDPETVEFSGENSVKIMSIHAAKGLEFEVVFIPFMWKGDYMGRTSGKDYMVPAELRKDNRIWQEKKNFKSAGDFKQALDDIKFEEERRIFYVACSRAKKILVLSYSEYGDSETYNKDNAKPKEIVPFFGDIINKGESNSLKIINKEGLDFVRENYNGELFRSYDNYEEVFHFIKPRGENKSKKSKNDAAAFTRNKWKSLEKKLYSEILKPGSREPEERRIINAVNTVNSHLIESNVFKDKETGHKFFPLTQILDYKKCPLLYKWKYVYLIPEKTGEELKMGEEIHKYIENITLIGFNNSRKSESNKSREKIIKDAIISRLKNDAAAKYIQTFIDSRFWDFSDLKSLKTEQLFYWKVDNYFIVGKFDRVDIKKNNRIEVIDYKVSGYSGGRDINNEQHNADRNIFGAGSSSQPVNLNLFQLCSYIGALSGIYKKPAGDIAGFLLYLKDGVEKSLQPGDDDIEKIKQDILGTVNNIKNNNFKFNYSNSCRKRCSYAGLCSHFFN
jgi:DNA helicase II / ATP-dependent DNA helicase PcrA